MNAKTQLLKVIDSAINDAKPIASASGRHIVDEATFWKIKSACANLSHVLADAGKPWFTSLIREERGEDYQTLIRKRLGGLQSLREAVELDLVFEIETLVRGETFANLLEQAEYLLSQSYVLAAGVIGRAIFEEHLRKWCDKVNCTPTKAKPTINDFKQALEAAGHLTKVDGKKVDWIAGVGNEAAHNLPTLKDRNVEHMLLDIRSFISAHQV